MYEISIQTTSFLAFFRVHTGSATQLCLLLLARFVTSSGAGPTTLISYVTESIHRFLGLPPGQRPPGLKWSTVLATESHSLRMMWPYNLRRASTGASSFQGWLTFLGRTPTFSGIKGDWANNGLVDLCLKIFWYFPITQDSSDLSPLESCHVAIWCNQGPKVFKLGCLLLMPVNLGCQLLMPLVWGPQVEVVRFGNVDLVPIFTEPAVPLLCLLLKVYAHWACEGDIVSVEKRPGVWSLEVGHHRVHTEDE